MEGARRRVRDAVVGRQHGACACTRNWRQVEVEVEGCMTQKRKQKKKCHRRYTHKRNKHKNNEDKDEGNREGEAAGERPRDVR